MSLRWVAKPELEVHEDFIGMYELSRTDAESTTAALKDVLLRCNLSLADLRGQAYDGAANMSGRLTGTATRIRQEQPLAQHIHCANHCLQLTLQKCASESSVVSAALSAVQETAVFLRASPKRLAQFQSVCDAINDEANYNIYMLCPTRWTVRSKAIESLLRSYQCSSASVKSLPNPLERSDQRRWISRRYF